MNSIKNREFNVRLIFDENGEASFGFMHGLYQKGPNLMEWKDVPDGIRRKVEAILLHEASKSPQNA